MAKEIWGRSAISGGSSSSSTNCNHHYQKTTPPPTKQPPQPDLRYGLATGAICGGAVIHRSNQPIKCRPHPRSSQNPRTTTERDSNLVQSLFSHCMVDRSLLLTMCLAKRLRSTSS
ncbi:hypothetical protein ACH5RR_039336 [Cinchona calisaya]|uniref:Uncharacterized protein n=1 Tax=Cinchona calisaya TaxID=153742 RepID=A0ABD2XZC1_9GENT